LLAFLYLISCPAYADLLMAVVKIFSKSVRAPR